LFFSYLINFLKVINIIARDKIRLNVASEKPNIVNVIFLQLNWSGLSSLRSSLGLLNSWAEVEHKNDSSKKPCSSPT
tara:strand:+ start:442 stop:672 length:231 start_codon:yes stop_codon:yes gene_type:complete